MDFESRSEHKKDSFSKNLTNTAGLNKLTGSFGIE